MKPISGVDQVFDSAIYHSRVRGKWRAGQTIIFVHKANGGDGGVVGYGVIEYVYKGDELSEEEKSECKKMGMEKSHRIQIRHKI